MRARVCVCGHLHNSVCVYVCLQPRQVNHLETLININTAINLAPAAPLGVCSPVSAYGTYKYSIGA